MQGRLDSPLTPAGREHARQHGELLKRERVERLIVSPLGRTRETAAIANAGLDAPLGYDDRLVERHCGDWGGLTVDEVSKRYPDLYGERLRDPYHARPPGGENLPDMLARVRSLLNWLPTLRERRVALVSHGVMGRVILTHYLGLTPEQSVAVAQPNDLIYRLDFEPAGVVCHFYHGGEEPTQGTYPLPRSA